MKHLIFSLTMILTFSLALSLAAPGAAYASGNAAAPDRQDQRNALREMRENTLEQLYLEVPGTEHDIRNAAGYAVFDSADIAALFIGGAAGRGLAHDNRTGTETFMRMASIGFGLGLGARGVNTVFIFDNPGSFEEFVNTGLDLSAHGDLVAKQGTRGGSASLTEDILPGVRIYQLTSTGLMAQVMLRGTRFWQDAALNDTVLSPAMPPQPQYNP